MNVILSRLIEIKCCFFEKRFLQFLMQKLSHWVQRLCQAMTRN